MMGPKCRAGARPVNAEEVGALESARNTHSAYYLSMPLIKSKTGHRKETTLQADPASAYIPEKHRTRPKGLRAVGDQWLWRGELLCYNYATRGQY